MPALKISRAKSKKTRTTMRLNEAPSSALVFHEEANVRLMINMHVDTGLVNGTCLRVFGYVHNVGGRRTVFVFGAREGRGDMESVVGAITNLGVLMYPQVPVYRTVQGSAQDYRRQVREMSAITVRRPGTTRRLSTREVITPQRMMTFHQMQGYGVDAEVMRYIVSYTSISRGRMHDGFEEEKKEDE